MKTRARLRIRAWRGLAAAFLATPLLALAGDKAEVRVVEYKFNPPELQVKVGTTVTWFNDEKRASHSVLFLGPEGFESERMFPGESWSRTFDKPGSYPYSCGPHPEMKGLIQVIE